MVSQKDLIDKIAIQDKIISEQKEMLLLQASEILKLKEMFAAFTVNNQKENK
jgi:hypothetical protein